jgi:serralysin
MSDIRLTKEADRYTQPEAERDQWNNVFGEEGDDYIALFAGTFVGGKGNDTLEHLTYPSENRHATVAYWNSSGDVTANFKEGWVDDGFGTRDTLIGVFQFFWGSNNGNTFIGSDRPEGAAFRGPKGVYLGGGGYDSLELSNYWNDAGEQWYRLDQVVVTVSADGRKAVIQTRSDLPTDIPAFRYELEDVEAIFFHSAGWRRGPAIPLADFVTPTLTAQQTIAAGADYRHDVSTALGTAQTISFSFMNAATAGSDAQSAGFRAFTDAEKALVRDIFASTSAAVGLTFQEVTETTASQGQIRFAVTQQSNTKGFTVIPGMAGAGARAGDVFMDVESMAGIKPGSEGYEALLHEIGHALGLRHPRNIDAVDQWQVQSLAAFDSRAQTVMATTDATDGIFRSTWGPLDWAALQYLYGAKPVKTGHDTYVLQPSTYDARATVIDHGGIDTIDASLSTVGVLLDLRPGAMSSVGMTSAGRAASRNLSVGVDTEIENAVGTPFDDVLIGNALDNRFWALSGNDWIEAGQGYDTVNFSATAREYALSLYGSDMTLAGRDGALGYASLASVEKLVFKDRTIELQTVAHEAYDDLPQELYQFFIVAFNAAPGVTYMNQLAEAYRYGYSVKQIVDVFITKPQFTDTYPTSLSNRALAERLVANIVGDSAALSTRTAAAQDIQDALDAGWTRGDVIYTIFGNLGKKDLSDPVWGSTAKLFQNQMAVAKHFTETLNFSTTDLTTLRGALGYVSATSSISSESLMTQLIADGLVGLDAPSAQASIAELPPFSDTADSQDDAVDWVISELFQISFTPLW